MLLGRLGLNIVFEPALVLSCTTGQPQVGIGTNVINSWQWTRGWGNIVGPEKVTIMTALKKRDESEILNSNIVVITRRIIILPLYPFHTWLRYRL